MNKITIDDILRFPKVSYGRCLGKRIANQMVNEMLIYKAWESKLGVPLEVLAQLVYNNCYWDGRGYHELGIAFVNQDGDCGIIINLKQWENDGIPIYLNEYKKKYSLGLDDPI